MSQSAEGSEIVKISTSRFGELEVPVSSAITVVGGIIGFPEWERYVLLDYNPPFSWLQCLDNADLAFVVINAAEFGDEYKVPIPIGDHQLELEEKDEIAIVNLVSVRPDPTLTTVNLKAPVVVNMKNRKGRQIVIDNANYPTRMPLWAPGEGEGE